MRMAQNHTDPTDPDADPDQKHCGGFFTCIVTPLVFSHLFSIKSSLPKMQLVRYCIFFNPLYGIELYIAVL
jgi:hypothetical protein